MVELNNCNRDHTACKPKYFLYGPLQKMFAIPCKQGLFVDIEIWVLYHFHYKILLFFLFFKYHLKMIKLLLLERCSKLGNIWSNLGSHKLPLGHHSQVSWKAKKRKENFLKQGFPSSCWPIVTSFLFNEVTPFLVSVTWFGRTSTNLKLQGLQTPKQANQWTPILWIMVWGVQGTLS